MSITMLLMTPLLPLNAPQKARLIHTSVVDGYNYQTPEPDHQTDKGSRQPEREHRNRYRQ